MASFGKISAAAVTAFGIIGAFYYFKPTGPSNLQGQATSLQQKIILVQSEIIACQNKYGSKVEPLVDVPKINCVTRGSFFKRLNGGGAECFASYIENNKGTLATYATKLESCKKDIPLIEPSPTVVKDQFNIKRISELQAKSNSLYNDLNACLIKTGAPITSSPMIAACEPTKPQGICNAETISFFNNNIENFSSQLKKCNQVVEDLVAGSDAAYGKYISNMLYLHGVLGSLKECTQAHPGFVAARFNDNFKADKYTSSENLYALNARIADEAARAKSEVAACQNGRRPAGVAPQLDVPNVLGITDQVPQTAE